MKKLFFALILIASFCQADYSNVKETFKIVFYNGQKGLMNRKDYYSFIESHFQKAEKELKLVQYFMKHPNDDLARYYCSGLYGYTVQHFHVYAGTSFKKAVTPSSLREVIYKVKEEAQLNDLDVQKELEATKQLLEESNKAFYKKLSALTKAKIWVISKTIGLRLLL